LESIEVVEVAEGQGPKAASPARNARNARKGESQTSFPWKRESSINCILDPRIREDDEKGGNEGEAKK
jgi:hypothetical protein